MQLLDRHLRAEEVALYLAGAATALAGAALASGVTL
ncbi:uncharacterized protein NP_5350A [Natronomonas pharaonis DSM 2160]|uniref:Uncharacterized protein n=1 Tax=Natronomonas pharaonis (strain ATCC 35678 / DSM 2160 / CIP 103997 / JCM 8858 / NBRC 14720 / NCIMB 2260 / Gabara) TaxID=348780 RepID=A0A1U7EZN5_NATPD|nr:uncharacterized protein NP_5350A [Natronomonas pharaonis DSM 2160]